MITLASIPRVPKLGLLAATAVGGAALAALTPSIMPRTKQDRMILAAGGGIMGLAAGGAALGAMALSRGSLNVAARHVTALEPVARGFSTAYQPIRTALTAGVVLGAGITLATHWSPGVVPKPTVPTYDPEGAKVITSAEEQAKEPAKPGTSQVGREHMNRSGLRFLDTIMTGLKTNPVRVYTSLGNGATPEERIQFTIDRMREEGAFAKSRIVVAQPTGSGYVDQMPIQSAEILAKGDIATVAVQYGDSPSLSVDSIMHRQQATDQYAMLLKAIKTEVDKLPAADRPKVYAYGYSLGSWGTQDALTNSPHDFDDLGVTRALWIGTPGPSHWSDRMAPDTVVKAKGLDSLLELHSSDMTDGVRALGYDNVNDPITTLDPSGLYSRPDYMKADDNPSKGAWIPGITYLQNMVDAKIAIEASQPGVWKDDGHQYRIGDAKSVDLAFDLPEVSDERLQRISDQTEQLEQRYFATHTGK